MHKHTRNLIGGTITVFIMLVLVAGLSYLFRVALASKLSVEDFGLFFAVFSFVGLVFGFKGIGTAPAYVRYISEYRVKGKNEDVRRVFFSFSIIQVVFSVLILVGVLALSSLLARYYFKTESAYVPLLILSVAFFFSMIFTLTKGFFAAYQKMVYFSMPDLLQAAVVLVLSVVLLRYHASPESPAFAYLASFIIVGLISLCLVFMKFPFLRERTTLNKETFVSLVQFGVPIAIGSVFTSLLASIDIVALTYFASLSDVAFYTAALATANIVRYIPKAVSTAIFPVSAELSVTNNPQFGPGLAKLYLYMFVAVAPFSAVLIALADQILALLFGTQFVAGSRALQILAAGAVFSAVQPVNLNIIMGIGRPKEYMRLALITGVSSVIALAILTPLWGSTGAAIGIVIAFVLSYIISIRTIKSNVPFNFPWKKYILTALAAILLGLVLLAIETFFDPTLVWTAVSVVAGGLLYLLLLTALRVISPRDFGLELRGWKFHRSRRL